MARWINGVHCVATHVHIPVIIKQIPRIRYYCIRREELTQFGVIVAGVQVHQAGAIEFLAGELVVGYDGAGIPLAAIGEIALVCGDRTVAVSFQCGAAQVIAMQIKY
jgi:hypothetical protein